MKVQGIKIYSNQAEITNSFVMNTDYVKEFITKRIQNCLNYEQLCEVFTEIRNVFIEYVFFKHIEFDFRNKILNVFYTFNSKLINLKVFLK